MSLRSSRWTGVFAALWAAAVPIGAAAGPGNGIRLGGADGRLHPYLELESRWDSNVLFEAGQPSSGLFLHVRPGLNLTYPSDKVAVEADARLDWQKSITDGSPDLTQLFAEAHLGVDVNRKGVVGLQLTDEFQRTADNSSLTFGSAVVSSHNTLDLALGWRPGGGALEVTGTGTWLTEAFEPYGSCNAGDPPNASCDTARLKRLGYDEYRAGLEAKWRFLPRTALLVDGSWTTRKPNDTTESPPFTGWRAGAGFQGLVTANLAATLRGGWGSANTEGGGGISTWLARAEVEWIPTLTASARLGYVHDWGGDPGQPFALYTTSRVYLDGKALLAGRWSLAVGGQYEYLDYQLVGGTSGIFRFEPSADYEVARWLTVGVGYAWTSRNVGGFENAYPGFPTQFAYDFSKNELWLRARGTY